ncbi:peroxisomal membrane anchor protein conserved region-domain-containing protein [Aspergillus heterothallicus]
MADSDKKPSIPLWQQQASTAPPPDDKDQDASKDTDRSTLLEQASKFLQDESIRDASTDRKITFLESKGLTSPEIDSLLGVSRNSEASSDSSNSTEEDKRMTASATETPTQSSPTLPNASPSSPSATPAQSSSSTPRDVPPIITYPEFLLHQSKPPPLVTLRSVLYTLYGAAGLGAAFYTASEYIVKPMLANLTDARHDLAATTEANLKKLNEKLEQNVTQIPPSLLSTKSITSSAQGDMSDEEGDIESITSDPTELFHRDIGTQTTQDLTNPAPTISSSTTAQDPEPPTPSSTATAHQKRLEQIGSQLREFADTQTTSSTLHDTTRSRISDLQRYLDGLLYSKSSSYPYSATTGYGMYSTPGLDSGGGTATGVAKGEEDAISSFRAEIRGVKGALLSARNFPSSRSGLRTSVR